MKKQVICSRLIAMLMVFMLCMALVPLGALADGEAPEGPSTEEAQAAEDEEARIAAEEEEARRKAEEAEREKIQARIDEAGELLKDGKCLEQC